jgi:hypothetical protein
MRRRQQDLRNDWRGLHVPNLVHHHRLRDRCRGRCRVAKESNPSSRASRCNCRYAVVRCYRDPIATVPLWARMGPGPGDAYMFDPEIPQRRITSRTLCASAMSSRSDRLTARSDRSTTGRNECTTTANAINPAAEEMSLDGCPAMLSTVSFAAETPMIVSPTAVGLDRTLRTCVRGAAAVRRSAPAIAAITNSVTKFECSLGAPNNRVTTRWRTSLSTWNAMTTSPTNSLALLMCSERTGGADCVGGIPA